MPSVLLVDDQPHSRTLLESCFTRLGWSVLHAADGDAALALLGSTPADLIVSERHLSGLDGLEYLRRLRADSRLGSLPVVIFTGSASGEADRESALRLGVAEFLLKSAPPAETFARLGALAAECHLRETEERFRQVTENINEVFWLHDLATGRFVYVSPAFDRIWGFPAAELLADPARWPRSLHRADAASVAAAREALARGHPYAVEYRIVRPDGTERWIRDRAYPVRRPDGTAYRLVGIAADFTVEHALEEQIRQARKMEAVGQLAGGIAHDFNNLLTVIQMHGSILAQRRDPALDDNLRPMLEAASRAAQLTRQLLTFSRRQLRETRPVHLGDIVARMLRLLRRALGEEIRLETSCPATLPLVEADENMVEQIVMNLAVNARDAMPRGGRLDVGFAVVDADAARTAPHAGVAPGRFVCMHVTDTGEGISPAHLPRIFEPFFTTKPNGQGTGLGLATVFGIARQHGGWVEAESTPGAGATFRVFLPALHSAFRPAPVGAADTSRPAVAGGRERILVVEDDAGVRNVARNVLRKLGYDVVEAANAADALAAWSAAARPFDLLLTDLIMPGGTTGSELAAELQRRRPDLAVVYMSGYSDEIVSRRLPAHPGENLLLKPFELEELGRIVRRALDRCPADRRAENEAGI